VLIGISWPTLTFPFAQALKTAADTRAKLLNALTVETDANEDVTTELNNVQGMIREKINCLMFVGAQEKASVASIEAANKAHVPVVEFNALTTGGQYVTFVGSVQSQSGQLEAQWLVSEYAKLGKPAHFKVLLLHGVAGQEQDIDRYKAYRAVLTSAGLWNKPGFTIIQQYANFDRATALTVTQSALEANPDINVITAFNDDMALGALSAVQAAGKAGRVKIIGIDGEPEMLNDIKAGKTSATVFQNPEAQGAGAMQACVDYLNGKKLPKQIVIPFVLTTSSNVNKVLTIANRVYPKS
jgi:ABC-type sugar transport system substrate-binding protein